MNLVDLNVLKFGGASVNCANAVKNFVEIVELQNNKTIIVISAMGKTTNLLEQIANDYHAKCKPQTDALKNFHLCIVNELFAHKNNLVFLKLNKLFAKLDAYLQKEIPSDYDYDYDQIVSFGELFSTTIISEYLREKKLPNTWIDIRSCLKTDSTYREGKVNWELSGKLIPDSFHFKDTSMYVTQGFLGGTENGLTTSLGREGSDYTAAILAYVLNAKNLCIWKDVPGIMNADPKWMNDAKKLTQISYKEAVELAFYGAKVIHPKTIQPIKKKKIPLQVRSFVHYNEPGTLICDSPTHETEIPVFIRKINQVLLSVFPKDFSFILEENLSQLFALFSKHRVKVNLIQNSAVSFSVCVDQPDRKLQTLLDELSENFKIRYNSHVELVTIRHYNQESINKITLGREILVEQRSRDTAQFVMKAK